MPRFTAAWDEPTYRLYESDGTVCVAWLPDEYPHGSLDGGGFDSRSDAECFKLGVDYERALHGLIPGVTADDIEQERHALDSRAPIAETGARAPIPEAEAPVVEYRRRVA